MDYPLMEPPFEMKPFKQMSNKEAKRHFDWYTHEIPKRIELLKNALRVTGGVNSDQLDYSPKSLIPLWKWFLSRVDTISKTPEEMRIEVKAVPDWLKETIAHNTQKLTVGTLSLAMDIALYFGEVFATNFDSLQWGYVTKPKSLQYVNSPVIIGFKIKVELNPRNLINNLTFLMIAGGDINPETLYNLFEVWKEYV